MAATHKNRLGRGLASLIGDLEADGDGEAGVGYRLVAVDALHPSAFNPRRDFAAEELDELAASIRERGLVQPIIVRPRVGGEPGFEIVAGERRWRAAQRAALHQVPVIVRSLDDAQALELAIIENVQRTDLNPIEEAHGYRQLIDAYRHSQEELAAVLGKSRSHVANTLRLLNLPESVQKLVREGALTAGHARALIGHPDAESLAREIVADGLSVREVEALMQSARPAGAARKRRKAQLDADTRAAQAELTEALGLKVRIAPRRGEAGELRIHYRSLEQFEDLRRRLLGLR